MIYDYQCLSCEADFTYESSIKDRELPKPCPECGEENSKKVFRVAPNVFNHAYHDGVKRAGFAQAREQVKLEKEMMNKRPEERKLYKKEIKKINKQ